jgi:hypothetical protein
LRGFLLSGSTDLGDQAQTLTALPTDLGQSHTIATGDVGFLVRLVVTASNAVGETEAVWETRGPVADADGPVLYRAMRFMDAAVDQLRISAVYLPICHG